MNLSDAADRRRAATEFDRNLVVVAGAGTGKTALLVERALNLVAGAGIPIGQLAAITFTEKAAAELRERLAAGLEELHALAAGSARADAAGGATEAARAYAWLKNEAGADAEAIARRALAALLDLDSASVSTLHAFCSEILRRFPREAGVDPAFRVDEGPIFRSLFEEEWDRFLLDEMGPGARRAEIWRRALGHPGALEAVRALGPVLALFRLPWDPEREPGCPAGGARDLLAGEIALMVDRIAGMRRRATGMNRNMERFLDQSARCLQAYAAGGASSLASVQGEWSFREYLDKDIPSPGQKLSGCTPEEVRETAGEAHELVVTLSRVDEEAIAAIVEAAAPLARRARERLLASGYVSFDGLLRLARDLLAGHPEIRRELGGRHRAILVDEFQDTDPLQYEILLFLAEEHGDPSSDPYAARIAPGRLFIVGDPKQSIYRFRGADIAAYRRAVDRIAARGGDRLTLNNSFRSPSGILEPLNALFEAFIGRESTGEQPAYEPIVSALQAAEDRAPALEIWSVAAVGGVEERRRAEGEAIAAWISEHLDRREATGEPLQRRGVALLFRALTNVGVYAQAMRNAGLEFVVEGGKNFYERPEVGDLIAFLRAASNPNDGAAALAVLRGPLGGVDDAELAAFAAAGGRLDSPWPAGLDGARFPGVRRTLDFLASFRSDMRGQSPDDSIRAALRQTPLLVLHASQFEGPQRVANLNKLSARAEDLARRGLSLEETLGALEEEFQESRDEGESPLADETVDAVRILSVHKAKGLEFPVVFVPDVGRERRSGALPGLEAGWVEGPEEGLLAVRLKDGTTNAAWIRHARSARRHEEAEEKRVLYVACTRAMNRLILVNSNDGRRAPWRDALAALGYSTAGGFPAAGVLPGGSVAHRIIPAPATRPVSARPAVDPLWREAALSFERAAADLAATRPPLRSPAGAADASPQGGTELLEGPRRAAPSRAARPADRARDAARLAGSALHAALERWDFRSRALLRDLALQAVDRVLSEESDGAVSSGLRARVTEETGGIVDEILRSPLPARLASRSILGREVPLIFRDERGVTWSGVCDLIYRDERGQVVAADYKTERLDGDPGPAAERYRPQMRLYVEALRRALPGETVRAEILFVRSGISAAL
jgi:ATP-dependent helicase/nuclease subunit A